MKTKIQFNICAVKQIIIENKTTIDNNRPTVVLSECQ
jgi:hypothetical protein